MNNSHWELRNKLVTEFENDARENFELLKTSDSELNRRNYVRSLFALYEITLSNLRETIAKRLIEQSEFRGKLDIHKLNSLMDESATINSSGKITKRYNQIPLGNMVKFVLKTYCDEMGLCKNLFSEGFSDFKKSIEIRNRITHPKYDQDFRVTKEDLYVIEKGRKWWNSSLYFIRDNGR